MPAGSVTEAEEESTNAAKSGGPRWIRTAHTVNIYLAFIGLGLTVAIPGPTLLDLELLLGVDTKQISYIYTARSSGYLAGSFIGGFLLDRLNAQLMLLGCTLVAAVTFLAIPWSSMLALMIIVISAGGLAGGALDTGGNCLILNLWAKESSPYMQALHFTFGLGAFIAPFLAEPFLAPITHKNDTTYLNTSDMSGFYNDTPSNSTAFDPKDLQMYIPYTIIGAFMALVGVSYGVMYFMNSSDIKPQKSDDEKTKSEQSIFTSMMFITLLMDVYFFTYCGAEILFGQLIATYAVKSDLQLSKSTGSFLTSAFWGTFTVGRGIGVLWAMKSSPFCMLFCDHLIMLAADLILVFFGNTSEPLLWIGTILIGMGMSSFYASVIAWLESHMTVSNKMATSFVVAGCSSEMLFPLIIGQYIDTKPKSLMYFMLLMGLISFALFFVSWRLLNSYKKKSAEENKKVTARRENEPLHVTFELKDSDEEHEDSSQVAIRDARKTNGVTDAREMNGLGNKQSI